MIDVDPQVSSTYLGRAYKYNYYIFPERNIFYCEIPKCASSSMTEFIMDSYLTMDEPYCFAIIREPLGRLKTALWTISNLLRELNNAVACPACGYFREMYDVKALIDELNGSRQIKTPVDILLHAFPQTEFLNNFPVKDQELKLFRIDQVNEIFNQGIPIKNKVNTDGFYKEFMQKCDLQIELYKPFLLKLYKNDFELWRSLNK